MSPVDHETALELALSGENKELAADVLARAGERGITLGCAESCTGGLIAATLTAVPGSSACFKGGVVSYWAEVKESVLGVPAETIARQGVISRACAEAMARGARQVLGCDCAVSSTGIAGPDGAEPGKPVGTVCLGIATAHGVDSIEVHCDGSRAEVRLAAVNQALQLLFDSLK